MSNETIMIHDVSTDEVIVRKLTDAEQEQRDAEVAAWESEKLAETQAKAEAQAKRQALLDKLGITEDEARLLLGGN